MSIRVPRISTRELLKKNPKVPVGKWRTTNGGSFDHNKIHFENNNNGSITINKATGGQSYQTYDTKYDNIFNIVPDIGVRSKSILGTLKAKIFAFLGL